MTTRRERRLEKAVNKLAGELRTARLAASPAARAAAGAPISGDLIADDEAFAVLCEREGLDMARPKQRHDPDTDEDQDQDTGAARSALDMLNEPAPVPPTNGGDGPAAVTGMPWNPAWDR